MTGVDTDLARMDATAHAELVRSGQASPVELVDAAIARIEELNPKLNAVIHELYEEGRAAAANSLPEGPFRGVPFLFKDIGAALAGQPFHLGTRILKELDFRAPVDTFLGQRFRAAGFVTIGKTNTPELGILPTTEPNAYGPTRNPWNVEHTPGGSSGGSAAAVASGMVPVAHANDGGGSIRIPASHCGLVGLKPSRQRISEGPLIGDNISGLTAELVLTRSVRDVAAVLDAVHGPAPGDPYVAPPPARPYVEELEAEPGQLRIALVTRSAADIPVDPAVTDAARQAAQLLESLGHAISERALADASPDDGTELIESFMIRWEAGQAATLATLERVLNRPIRAEEVEPLTWALAEAGRAHGAGEYLQAVGLHQLVSRVIAGWLDTEFDLLLTPTVGEPPPQLGAYDDSGPDPMRAIRRAWPTAAFSGIFNATGQPAISIPLHRTDDGLPVGVQLVAPLGREDLLIRIAAQVERERPWIDATPPIFAGSDT
ncbi:MAG TPA: amidase [Solirubrobacterales bacterium]|nr:amidase [Solirubrobacterales bacterium]